MRERLLTTLVLLIAAGCASEAGPEGTTASAQAQPTTDQVPSETAAAPPQPSTEVEPAALRGLPGYTAGYRMWTKLNRKPIPPRDSGDAHSGTKNLYASNERRPNGRFPDGTILVKEAIRPGKDFLGLIAVMRKEKGVDPSHNDWRFVEYTRESKSERFSETARDAVCWSCHMGAAETDYVWIYTLGLVR